MEAQRMQDGLRFVHNGMQHARFASTHELTSRLTSYMESKEAAWEVLREAERIGLIEPDGLISNPTLMEKGWRLSAGFDARRLGVPA